MRLSTDIVEKCNEALAKVDFTSKHQWIEIAPNYKLRYWFDGQLKERAELYQAEGGEYKKVMDYRIPIKED